MMNDMWKVSTSPARGSDSVPPPATADPFARAEKDYLGWLKDSPSMKQPCKYFSFGGCTKGDECPYAHDLTVEAKNEAESSRGFVLMNGKVANMPTAEGDAPQQRQLFQQQGEEWDAPTGQVPPSRGSDPYGDESARNLSRYDTQPDSTHQWNSQQQQPKRRHMPTHEYAALQQQEFVRKFQDYTKQKTEASQTGIVSGTSPQPTRRRAPGGVFPSYQNGTNPAAAPFQPSSGGAVQQAAPQGQQYNDYNQYSETNNFGFRRQQAMRPPLSMNNKAGVTGSSTGSRTPPSEADLPEISGRRIPPQLAAANFEQHSRAGSSSTMGTPTATLTPHVVSEFSRDSPAAASIASPTEGFGSSQPSPLLNVGTGSNTSSSSAINSRGLSYEDHRKMRNGPVSDSSSAWSRAPLAVGL